MIEEKIDGLTAQIKRLNDNLEKLPASAKATVADAAAGAKGAAKAAPAKAAAKKSQFTFDQVKGLILEVKEKVGQEDAKTIIEDALGAGAKMAGLATTPEHYDAVVAACQEKLGASGDADDEPAEEDDGL